MESRPRADLLPVSHNEERAWIESQLTPDAFSRRRLSASVPLPPRASSAAIRQAVSHLTKRHEVLRTAYTSVAGRPCRSVLADWSHDVVESDGPAEPAASGPPAELLPPDLVRFRVASPSGQRRLAVDLSEMVTDTWSCARLQHELTVLLDPPASGPPADLAPAGSYAEFAAEQRRRMVTEAPRHLRGQWLSRLRLSETPGQLAPDGPDPGGDVAGERILMLTDELMGCLGRVAARHRLSPFMVVVALLQMLLATRSPVRDIVLTTTAANRSPRWAEVQGSFANTVLLPCALPADPTFADVAVAARRSVLAGLAHQELPYLLLKEALVREAIRAGEEPSLDDPPIRIHYLSNRTHHFTVLDSRETGEQWTEDTDFAAWPIDIGFLEDGHRRVAVWVNYDARLFSHALVAGLVDGLWTTLRLVSGDPLLTCARLRQLTGDGPETPPRRGSAGARPAARPEGQGDPLEGRLAAIWARVLGVPEVAAGDDLFLLGGGIVSAFEIAAAAEREGLSIDPATLLATRSVAAYLSRAPRPGVTAAR
jgi:hypothetical protein